MIIESVVVGIYIKYGRKWKVLYFLFNKVFKDVVGGCKFNLIKFRNVLKKIVDGILNIIWIIIIFEIFGKICLIVIF